jgi:RNA polymerase sigma-70 factor (ECF subfamily)
MSERSRADVERIVREHYGKALSVLTRHCGNLDDAQEAVQEAFMEAFEHWPLTGVPPSPVGWIITTAKHRAIDRQRREALRPQHHADAANLMYASDEPEEESVMRDDQLRLIFTCCHPALNPDAQVALTLRLIGGLSTPEIAHAFLVSETTMAQRIVRAKAKIRAAGIPYRIPDTAELPMRLQSVLAVVYLIFNEGYKASAGEALSRDSLTNEAIRLGRLLAGLMPDEPEVAGLLALMLLNASRLAARADANGELILLGDQDRNLWDSAMIAEGQALVRACVARNQPGPYQLQAAISAVHSKSANAGTTDWKSILHLYDLLLQQTRSPIVGLHRAVALSEVRGLDEGLNALEQTSLEDYYLYHAIRADLLRRLDRFADASSAYQRALALADNASERRFLQGRLAALSGLS